MPDAVEPLGQNVQQEAPDELVGGERHRAIPGRPVVAIVLVAEGHAALVERDEAAVRDGDAVGIACEIGEYRLRAGKRRLGVHVPVLPRQWREMSGEGFPAPQAFDLPEERQSARRVGVGEGGQEEPAEQAGEHPHRQQEAGSAAYPTGSVQ